MSFSNTPIPEVVDLVGEMRICLEKDDYDRIVDELYLPSKIKRSELLDRLKECSEDYIRLLDYALSMERWSNLFGACILFDEVQRNFPRDTCLSFEKESGKWRCEVLPESWRVTRKKRVIKSRKSIEIAEKTGLSLYVSEELRRLKAKLVPEFQPDGTLPAPLQCFVSGLKWPKKNCFSNDPDESIFWAADFRFHLADEPDYDALEVYSEHYDKQLIFIGCDSYHLAGVAADDRSADPDVYWIDHEWSSPNNEDLDIYKLSDFLAELDIDKS